MSLLLDTHVALWAITGEQTWNRHSLIPSTGCWWHRQLRKA